MKLKLKSSRIEKRETKLSRTRQNHILCLPQKIVSVCIRYLKGYFSIWKAFGISLIAGPLFPQFLEKKIFSSNTILVTMMMNCSGGMIDRRKTFSLISSWDHCQRSSSSRISLYKIDGVCRQFKNSVP